MGYREKYKFNDSLFAYLKGKDTTYLICTMGKPNCTPCKSWSYWIQPGRQCEWMKEGERDMLKLDAVSYVQLEFQIEKNKILSYIYTIQ
jgi:hypothetical protein